MEILRNVPTNELQVGDTVLVYGMRVHLSRPVHKWVNQGDDCWSWHGDVLNPDDVTKNGFIPKSWLRREVWENGKWSADELFPVWNVQGNELATWTVERP